MGLRAGSPHCGEEVNLLLLLEAEPQSLGCPAHNLVFIPTVLSQFLGYKSNREIKITETKKLTAD
jgi:hypothetical protein